MSQKVPEELTLQIERIGIYGEGIGYHEGYTIFVDGGLPNETLKIRMIERKKSYGRGSIIEIIHPSSARIAPPCPYFSQCGGCQIMHLEYQQQLAFKRQRVVDALERIGKFSGLALPPCQPSPLTFHYRNKIQLPVTEVNGKLALGLYRPRSHDILPIDHCLIHCTLGERVYETLCELLSDFQNRTPRLRYIIIKTGIYTNEVLVGFVTDGDLTQTLKPLGEKLMQACPEVKGVLQNINRKDNNVIMGKQTKAFYGALHIHEKLFNKLLFKVSLEAFFQVNVPQAEFLYAKAREFAGLKGDEVILDACCGVGTLTLYLAQFVKMAYGIEIVPGAIEDAKTNAKLNAISNVSFICADIENAIKTLERIDVLFVNPPRKGCSQAFLEQVNRLSPKKIIYISCDPATLARDLAICRSFGFAIEAIQTYDMFPQTSHVETIVKLVKDPLKVL